MMVTPKMTFKCVHIYLSVLHIYLYIFSSIKRSIKFILLNWLEMDDFNLQLGCQTLWPYKFYPIWYLTKAIQFELKRLVWTMLLENHDPS